MSAEMYGSRDRSDYDDPDQRPTLGPMVVVELIGTFFIVLTYSLAFSAPKALTTPQVAVAAAWAAMTFMGAHISGAHFNPAVTLAVWLRGKIDMWTAGCYILVQLAAGLAAAAIASLLVAVRIYPHPGTGLGNIEALFVELFFTFALCFVVLNVSTTQSQRENSFFGLAIGLTYLMGAFACAHISGAVFNPALATGVILVNFLRGGNVRSIWIYWLGPLIGGLLAALLFRWTNANEFKPGYNAAATLVHNARYPDSTQQHIGSVQGNVKRGSRGGGETAPLMQNA